MDKFSCHVCMDLIPLVKDGIASEDSCALVKEHIATCENCSNAFGEKSKVDTTLDDTVILGKIKKQLTLLIVSIMFAGTLIGLVLSDGIGMFYNVLIMPGIGGFGYMLLRKKAYCVPLGLFFFSFIWLSIREITRGFLSYSGIAELLVMSAWWSAIFAVLSAVGILIAGLLSYAFRKEI
jgi:hypothetical protein